jgi:hypothetical protein
MDMFGKGGSKRRNESDKLRLHSLKKCPHCFAMLSLDAKQCDACKKRVGKLDKAGFAKMPIDVKSYVYCVVSWTLFAFYIWWAFFRK